MKFEFISAKKAQFPVTELCRTLEVFTSGYYARSKREKSQRQVDDERWLKLIGAIFDSSR